MSVKRCQREISSVEFTHWVALWKFHTLDPVGWEQTAMTCASIGGSAGAKVKPMDFIPVEKLPQSMGDMLKEIELSVIAHQGGTNGIK